MSRVLIFEIEEARRDEEERLKEEAKRASHKAK
jgi:hypothetical protein